MIQVNFDFGSYMLLQAGKQSTWLVDLMLARRIGTKLVKIPGDTNGVLS